jgi:predicted enzyme related to lactoylglutathione lyase
MRAIVVGMLVAVLAGACAAAQAQAQAQEPGPQPEAAMPAGAPIVFFDIAGPDLASQSGFYSAVFGWEVAPGGQVSVAVTQPLEGLIRTDPVETMLYFGVPDVTAALDAVAANGGAVVAPRFEVPGVVILGLFTDPAGNRMGLVEFRDGKAIVP